MKYVFRRLVAGVVLVPAVAVAWVAINATLIGLGATPTASVKDVLMAGFVLGLMIEIVFVGEQVVKVVKK